MANKFLTNIELDGDLIDINGNSGTSGQVLSSLGSGNGVDWIDIASDTAERIEVTVKNVSGGSLSKGAVVHASPSATPPSGNVIEVIAADYDDSTKMPAIGILNETIANEGEGSAVMMGAVSGIDTSSFSIGDELYVGNLGTLTNTKPATAGQLIQKIAVVIKSHASNGLIKIFGAGRSNDVPLPLYIDNTNQRVGIGDSTPSYTLDVNGTIYGSTVRSGRYYGTSGTSSYLDLDSGATYSLLASSEISVTDTITCNDLTATEPGGIAATNGPVYANRFYGNGNTTYFVDPNDSTTSAILNGKVGIGTTSPSTPLEVNVTGNNTVFSLTRDTGTNGELTVDFDGANANFDSLQGGHTFQTNGTERVKIDTSGRLGLGTSSPQSYYSGADNLVVYQSSGEGGITIATANNTNGALYFADGTSGSEQYRGGIGYNHSNDELFIVSGGSTKATIDSSGRLGLGTSSPDHKLHLEESDTTSVFLKTENTAGALLVGNNSSGNSFVSSQTSGKDLLFETANTERLRIGSSGQIGIGGANYGTSGQVLTSNGSGSAPSWQDASGGSASLSGGAANKLAIWSGTDALTNDTNLHWNTTNDQLGIGNANPQAKLDITQTATSKGIKIRSSSVQPEITFIDDATGDSFAIGHNRSGSRMDIEINGTDTHTFRENGKVGINTISPTNGMLEIHSTTNQISIETGTAGDGRLHIGHFSNGTFIGTYGDDGGAADLIRFGTHSGDERMRIHSNGNVSVGTANAYARFSVKATSHNNGISVNRQADTTAALYIGNDGGSNPVLAANNADMLFGRDVAGTFTERMRLTNSGNLGIGTSSPDQKLHVHKASAGTVSSNSNAIITAENNANGYIHLLVPDSRESGVLFGNPSSSVNGAIIYNNSGTSNGLQFRTSGNSTKMVINSSGNVGINTTSPAEKLQVVGNIGVGNGTYNGGVYANSSSTAVDTNWGLDFLKTTGQNDYSTRLKYYPTTGEARKGGIWNSRNNAWVLYGDSNNTPNVIIPSGNVGIGTTSPSTKLHVNGDFLVNNTSGAGNGSAHEIARLINTTSGATSSYMYIGASSGNDWRVGKNILGTSGNSNFGIALHAGSTLALEIDGSSNVISNVSSRAPIFYDSNNTSYYTDPAGTSNIQKLIVNTYGTGVTRQLTIKENSDTDNSMGHYPGAWTSALNIQSNDNSTYLWLSPLTSNIPRVQTNYGQLDFYTGNNTNRALHLSGTTARSSTFYDIDNTGYYINPAGTGIAAYLRGDIEIINEQPLLELNDYTATSTTNLNAWVSFQYNGTEGGYVGYGSDSNSNLYLYNFNGDVLINGSKAETNNSFRAPIFYDSNNTGYYVDPSGDSKIVGLKLEPGNGNNVTGSDNVLWVYRTTNNDWGIQIDADQGNATDYGFEFFGGSSHSYAYSAVAAGTRYFTVGSSHSQHDGSFRAPVFYDSNNTNYYSNNYGTSVFKNLTLRNDSAQGYHDGTIEFRNNSNNLGSHIEYTSVPGHTGYKIYISAPSASTTNVQYELENKECTFQSGTFHLKNNIVNAVSHSLTGVNLLSTPALKVYQRSSNISYTMYDLITFHATSSASQVGSIRVNAYGTQFATSSDYRLKENEIPIADGIQRVKQLQPKRFNFIGYNEQTVDGFMAHEVMDIVPESVGGVKDEVDEEGNPLYQSIDQSKLVPLLTAALKEAIAKIEDLETRVQSLENQ